MVDTTCVEHDALLRKSQLTDLANELAQRYSARHDVVGFVIGGSLGRGLADEHSDLEAYCYYQGALPSKAFIQQVIDDLGAVQVRSDNLHWDHPAWGTHSFFRAQGITVELGYREVGEIERKLNSYLFDGQVQTAPGDHDVPFGHYPSGLAACLVDCRILAEHDGAITRLKEHAGQFPESLAAKLLNFHVAEAQGIMSSKLPVAHSRSDVLHFQAALARVVRSIVIAIFTLNRRHFPGDKWNVEHMRDMQILPTHFPTFLHQLLGTNLTDPTERDDALDILRHWIDWLDRDD